MVTGRQNESSECEDFQRKEAAAALLTIGGGIPAVSSTHAVNVPASTEKQLPVTVKDTEVHTASSPEHSGLQSSTVKTTQVSHNKSSDQNCTIICPTKEQLSCIKTNITCTEEGCTKTFKHEGALYMHKVKSHGNMKTDNDRRLFHRGTVKKKIQLMYHCPQHKCIYSRGSTRHFSTFTLLKQHYMKVHAEKTYICGQCSQSYSMARDLSRHSEHCGELFQCGTCPVKYTTREALQTHCKRQEHIYPEEWRRKDKEKEEKKRKNKNSEQSGTQSAPMVTKFPVVFISIATPPAPPQPIPLKTIKPKPIQPSPISDNASKVISDKGQGQSSDRQDALIQTDIYGVSNLSVSGRDHSGIKMINASSSSDITPSKVQGHLINKRSKVTVETGTDMMDLSPNTAKLTSNFKSPQKKAVATKRKLGLNQNEAPHVKKKPYYKSTTGIQTSVSLTQKKCMQTVSGTQTTGDYILQAAMAKANIQIERKTVGSQVTPQKQRAKNAKKQNTCSSETQTFVLKDTAVGEDKIQNVNEYFVPIKAIWKPPVVDSFSQVNAQHIWTETSHNLAEQQTMTDLPESISTQTLQSFLINLQDKTENSNEGIETVEMNRVWNSEEKQFPSNEIILIGHPNRLKFSSTSMRPQTQTTSTGSDDYIGNEDVVNVYDHNLDSSVSFVVPPELRNNAPGLAKESQAPNNNSCIATPETDYLTAVRLDSTNQHSKNEDNDKASTNSAVKLQINQSVGNLRTEIIQSQQSSNFEKLSSIDINNGLTINGKAQATMDMEAQAMSANEFELLLQSSGIYMNHSGLSTNPPHTQSSAIQMSSQMNEPQTNAALGPEFDFLSGHVNTIDMNTQTGTDFDLFDSYVSIDTGTDTKTQAELDFLDLVSSMTNMETQTLNDDDLVSLGLENVGTATQSLGIGTSDFDENKQASLWSSTIPSVMIDAFTDVPVIGRNIKQLCDTDCQTVLYNQSMDKSSLDSASISMTQMGTSTESGFNPLCNQDQQTTTSLMESQTGPGVTESTNQMDTQTQVESSDTQFETFNMETQTTMEDLQFFKWLETDIQ